MKRTDQRIPYLQPAASVLEMSPAELLCGSPNHPGGEMPWFPGQDEDEI